MSLNPALKELDSSQRNIIENLADSTQLDVDSLIEICKSNNWESSEIEAAVGQRMEGRDLEIWQEPFLQVKFPMNGKP